MKTQKTLLALALSLAAASVTNVTYADAISDGDFYADVKLRFESSDLDDAADNKTANGLIADTAFGNAESYADMRSSLEVAVQAAGADDALEAQVLTSGGYVDFITHNIAQHLTDPLASADAKLHDKPLTCP